MIAFPRLYPPAPIAPIRMRAPMHWYPRGGWHQRDDGSWARIYLRIGARRKRAALRAVIRRQGGFWRWEIERFDTATRAVRGARIRGINGYLFWQAATGIADAAARTAD